MENNTYLCTRLNKQVQRGSDFITPYYVLAPQI